MLSRMLRHDSDGVVLPYIAMTLGVIIGAVGIGTRRSRLMTVQTQLQSGADALAQTPKTPATFRHTGHFRRRINPEQLPLVKSDFLCRMIDRVQRSALRRIMAVRWLRSDGRVASHRSMGSVPCQ
jgi:hypothetical protein